MALLPRRRTPFPLPPHRLPRPSLLSSRGASVPVLLPAPLSQSLLSLCLTQGVTPFMALLAAFQVLLSRYCGQYDLCVGFPIAHRNHPSLEGLIGFFANTLVLRSRFSPSSSFLHLLSLVRESTLAAYAHQDVPFDKLVESLNPPRDPGRSPLFQVMFSLRDAHQPDLDGAHLLLHQLEVETQTSLFELSLALEAKPTGFSGQLQFNTDLFTPATASRMASHYLILLEGLVAHPEQHLADVPLLTSDERHLLLEELSGTPPLVTSHCLHHLFEAQVARGPEATALVAGTTRLGYGELNRRANQLAHYLRARGAGPDVPIGICLPRTADLVVGLLAILKAGAAWLPLDPSYPIERLTYALEDARAPLLLTQESLRHLLPASSAGIVCIDSDGERISREPSDNPSTSTGPSHLAYILYTSGSTGRPKGVAIEHHSAVVLIRWALDCFTAEQLSGVLAATSICFDLSVFELFAPLSRGGTVLLADNALALPSLPAAHEVTLVNTVPSAIAELARTRGIPSSVRTINLAGEPLPGALARALYTLPSVQHVFNLYGPTEDTTYSTFSLVPRDGSSEPTIGRPLPGTRVYLLDSRLQPVPLGVPGELHLSGSGLARGYFNRPELTAERFIPDPFSGQPGARLYKTGDLARFLPDGSLEYLGRIDQQVKVRGFRIELGEIESILLSQPEVLQVAVLAREDVPGDKRLVAYAVAAPGTHLDANTLRRRLEQTLPGYMVPSAFVLLEALPLTPNGKIDRKALPPPESHHLARREFIPPRTGLEMALAQVWRELLKVDAVGVQDNFFELGGHSLLVTQAVSRILDTLQVELPVRAFFEAPTLEALAHRVEATLGSPRARQGPRPIPRPPSGGLPLSFAQQRLWFLEQMEPGSARYNLPAALRMEGPLDVAALELSFLHLVQRHESLRTTFRLDSHGPVQLVSPHSSFQLQHLDLSALAPSERPATVRHLSSDYALRPFLLSEGPLLRAALLHLEHDVHVLLLTLHHIVSDGWSLGVLLRELSALYQAFRQGAPPPLAELPLQYADFASWQRSFLQGEALLSLLSWWRSHLADAPPSLSLPTDFPRPSLLSSRGASVPVLLPAPLSQSLLSLCHTQGVTPFMALLAAFQVLLSRYCGQYDLCVGFPIAHRNHPSLEGLIGFFANTLVLRSRFSPSSSFLHLLSLVRESTLAAYAHQDVPFDKLVESLNPSRDPGRSPLFQVMFSLQNAPLPELALSELRLRPLESSSQTAKFELLLDLTETREGFTGKLEYSTDLFSADTVSLMAEHFLRLLEDAVAHPERHVEQLCEPITLEAALLQPQTSLQAGAHLPAPEPHVPDDSLTDLHHSLTTIWKEVLAIEHVGIHDNFFSLGGNSISAIMVLARLQDMGLSLKPEQILQKPTIAELVPLVTRAREVGEQGRVGGELPLTPIQRWFLESWEPQAHHFNQAVMLEVREELKPELLEKALRVLVEHHDALRLRFTRDRAAWRQENAAPTEKSPLRTMDHSGLGPDAQEEAMAKVAEEAQGGFELAEGHLLKAVLFLRGHGRTGRLLLVIHHLGVDGVSWRTLLEDLEKVYAQLERGEEAAPGAKTTSFKAWAERLEAYAKTPEVQAQLGYWEEQGREPVAGLPVDKAGGANTVASEDRVMVGLEEEETRTLLQEVPGAYGVRLDEVLLAALAEALGRWTGQTRVRVELEGHGREALFEEVDLSRTVGWFTALYPVVLETGRQTGAGEGLRAVKERLRRVPMKGLGYGLLRYSGDDEVVRRMTALPRAEVVFNYLGQFDTPLAKEPIFRPTREETGPMRSTRGTRPHLLEVNGLVFGRRLELTWSYSQHLHERATIERVAQDFMSSLRRFIANRKQEQHLSARLEELVHDTLREQRMMGMALLVEFEGGRRIQVAEGTSDPSGTPYTPTTRIGIGSLTKSFTAVLILQLVEEDRVSLDSTVDTWLPWLQRGEAITVRALLAHTSGLPDHLPRLTERGGFDTPWAPRALVELAMHEPPVPPGHYSNTNSIVLGLLIEALTGRTWEEELSRRILQPLGLSRTGPLTRMEGLAGAWMRSTDGWEDLRHAWHPSIGWAAGGMNSTAEELAVFGRALFSGSLFKHPATLEAMRTYAVRGNPERTGGIEHAQGLGLHLFHVQGLDVEGHLGTRPGYSVVLLYDARTRALVVATTNTHGAQAAFAGVSALETVRRAAP
ncbi:non-ribosomal peptide synthetase [Cystobacter fuscus]|uniref:non-ribosomal peptide synthetase n=1 Tax=Cystobacter fuscus TaxID=43 RepID=UPI0022B764F9|nr:non-ribosomal peptide synthetase [Cystobacter fuscus]